MEVNVVADDVFKDFAWYGGKVCNVQAGDGRLS